MASSLPNPLLLLLLLSLSHLLLLPSSLRATTTTTTVLTHHGGPLLTGNLNLTFIWYGSFGKNQKNVMRAFVKSLNYDADVNLEPQVYQWWSIVEGFQEAAGKGEAAGKCKAHITVQVGKQYTDANYSAGKIVSTDFLKPLIQKADGGDPNSIPVIFTAKDVKMLSLCTGNCSIHGVLDNRTYIVVGNPEGMCPGECGWPFHKAETGPIGMQLSPPNANLGTDAMVIAFAQALVNLVTNPFNSGFFQRTNNGTTIEVGSACPRIFGTGSLPGYTGKVRIDPATGGVFNAHGTNGKDFLLPAIWDPKTKSCWTLM